ncbi:MAG TPA: proline racemase family protein [Steroidobacteraceae bacterium]|nr:proline racemase family protein [Steroidobacteraceae bacterium]
MQTIRIVDSHTAGEPTRLVLEGGPELGDGPLDERARRFRERFDGFRSAIVNEPRGSDALVGALLCKPHRSDCALGVIFFNNVGCIGMCGHGTIGLVASLAHLGRCTPGVLRIDTPVGAVSSRLNGDGTVDVENVASYRKARAVQLEVTGIGTIRGDVAWGGNWFFLTPEHGLDLDLEDLEALTTYTRRVRHAINSQGFGEVDHIELTGPARGPGAHGRNFVLCPGGAYDRSPCGTGTSAKLACLAADGELAEGEPWVAESVIGSRFTARYRWKDRSRGEIVPTITGRAHVTSEALLRLDPQDPFCWGIAR